MSLRDEILGADDLATKTVHVPQWKRDVTIRAQSAAAREAWEAKLIAARANGENKLHRATILAWAIVDENGNRVFGDDDIPALEKKSAKAIDLLYDEFAKLNALTQEQREDIEKNFLAPPTVN